MYMGDRRVCVYRFIVFIHSYIQLCLVVVDFIYIYTNSCASLLLFFVFFFLITLTAVLYIPMGNTMYMY